MGWGRSLLEPLISDTCVYASHQDWSTGDLEDRVVFFPLQPSNGFKMYFHKGASWTFVNVFVCLFVYMFLKGIKK